MASITIHKATCYGVTIWLLHVAFYLAAVSSKPLAKPSMPLENIQDKGNWNRQQRLLAPQDSNRVASGAAFGGQKTNAAFDAAAELRDALHMTVEDATRYLSVYGYLPPVKSDSISDEMLRRSVRLFQQFNRLPDTGSLDLPTLVTMKQPRCGMRDIESARQLRKLLSLSDRRTWRRRRRRRRRKRSGWDQDLNEFDRPRDTRLAKQRITYALTKWSNKLSYTDANTVIDYAIQQWQKYINIKLVNQTGSNGRQLPAADLQLAFVLTDHGDGQPFDGAGGQLGHAFYPEHDNSGLIHFDDDEPWDEGRNLNWVAMHEIGHALGLRHSNNRDAIMSSQYGGYGVSGPLKLHDEDIKRIQKLYGKSRQSNAPKTPTPTKVTPKPRPSTVTRQMTTKTKVTGRKETSHSTMPSSPDTSTVANRENTMKPELENFVETQRRKMCEKNGNANVKIIDAAVTLDNGTIYLFQDTNVWTIRARQRANELQFEIVTVNPIGELFPGAPATIDFAFASAFGFVRLYSGGRLYEFDAELNSVGAMEPVKPRGRASAYALLDARHTNAALLYRTRISGRPVMSATFFQKTKYWVDTLQVGDMTAQKQHNIADIIFGGKITSVDAAIQVPGQVHRRRINRHTQRLGVLFHGVMYTLVTQQQNGLLKALDNHTGLSIKKDIFGC